ncbi:hypothetical protein HPB50_002159 [Hyalomma asiaticum]|uniref:Uncharacterized protein n=1 Tax=Hyalomma asiaticum TaxID=266040 RepID=A0ACB7RKV0_HYAAI|nr:hypothetical protein HPB50_002159 [Hyalomma asiaticum]
MEVRTTQEMPGHAQKEQRFSTHSGRTATQSTPGPSMADINKTVQAVDGVEFITTSSMEKATDLLLGALCTVNIAYPHGCPLTMEFLQRYFTTAPLFQHLPSHHFRATGKIIKDQVPKDFKLLDDRALVKKRRGSFCQMVNVADGICLVKWFDKPIMFASSQTAEQPVGECNRWYKKERVSKDVP